MASNTLQNYEQLGYGAPGLSMHRAKAVQVIGDAVATRTLTAKEAGATCLLDSAAGVVYTLPAPVAGMTFEFFATVSVTSNSYKVITNSASVFLLGAVAFGSATLAEGGGAFSGNGTSHVAITSNGSTTGGLIGTCFTVTALSSTVWAITGIEVGSGTTVTPFATS